MTRQELFEKNYADMHALPVETMQQYRWLHQDGYRLPGIAAAYRNFCAGWDAQASLAKTEHEFIHGSGSVVPKGLVKP
ncbi:hypothetical protein D3C81_1659130 [compost metagenome]